MRHVRELTRNGIRLHLIAGFILIPAPVNPDALSCMVGVGEAFKFNKHPVLIRRNRIAFTVNEVKHHIAILIKGIEIIPVANHNLQLSSLM